MVRKILLICVLACRAAFATNYFISPNGDDQHDGLSESAAWRTAAKVNASKFQPGDRILFARGGEWHEQLIAGSDGTDDKPVTYADYGDPQKPKPTFWGSDVIPPSAFTLVSGSEYSFSTSVLPTGNAFGLFANHDFLAYAAGSAKMPPNSFFISGNNCFIATAGDDPRTGIVVYTASDRAQGTNADSSLICSNGHNNLAFNNLIGRETAAHPDSGGTPDAYVFRIQGSRNVHLNNCEAFNGGKHHIGVINSTGFIGTNLLASGCMPNLGYGNAGAFVSFSVASRHGDTSEWIDCKVDHFDSQQQSFITHGEGLGLLKIKNLTSLGCGIAIGTDGPDEKVFITGGHLTGPTCDLYGTHIVVDGLRLGGNAKIDIFGNGNIVQNCVDRQSTNEQGAIIVRGQNNIIRFNTLDHRSGSAPWIDVKSSAVNTRIIGNLFTGGVSAINDEGAPGLILDFNGFDRAAGTPRGLERDIHLIVGDPHFADPASGNYALGRGSVFIGKVPQPYGNPSNIGAAKSVRAK